VIRLLLLLACAPAFACDYPDEGNMPLRRAVGQIKSLPEVEAWAKAMHEQGEVVQYALRLDEMLRQDRRCYWAVDVNAKGRTWRRYYVTPDGKRLRSADARRAGAALP
jgi:hypothetical protein